MQVGRLLKPKTCYKRRIPASRSKAPTVVLQLGNKIGGFDTRQGASLVLVRQVAGDAYSADHAACAQGDAPGTAAEGHVTDGGGALIQDSCYRYGAVLTRKPQRLKSVPFNETMRQVQSSIQ